MAVRAPHEQLESMNISQFQVGAFLNVGPIFYQTSCC